LDDKKVSPVGRTVLNHCLPHLLARSWGVRVRDFAAAPRPVSIPVWPSRN